MSWTSITVANVQAKLSGPEQTALRTIALAAGQADPLPEIIAQVEAEVRGYVGACSTNTLAASGIPSNLLAAAVAMIRYRLATRVPLPAIVTAPREEENKAALRLMEQVAACKFAVDAATGDGMQAGTGGAEQVGTPTRLATRATLAGL